MDLRIGGSSLDPRKNEVAESIRAGTYATNSRDGIIVDTVVGNTRCLLLVHEPTLTIKLSPREQEIARMVAHGRTNQAIAGALDISVWTVSTHLRRIFAKLAVGSRAEMVAHLLEQGVISLRSGCMRATTDPARQGEESPPTHQLINRLHPDTAAIPGSGTGSPVRRSPWRTCCAMLVW